MRKPNDLKSAVRKIIPLQYQHSTTIKTSSDEKWFSFHPQKLNASKYKVNIKY